MVYHRVFKGDIAVVPKFYEAISKFNRASCCAAIHSSVTKATNAKHGTNIRAFNDIPCAKRWPFGNKMDLLLAGFRNNFHEHIDRRHRQLGPIFRERLGPVEAVFIMAPDLIRDVFQYEGKYPQHPLPEAWNLYNRIHNCKRGLFFMDGEEWLQTRRTLAPLFFRNDDRFRGVIETMTDELINEWKIVANTATTDTDYILVPNLLTTLYRWSIHVIIGIMFGPASEKIITDQQAIIDHLSQSVHGVFDSSAPLATISPHVARKFNLKYWQSFEQNVTQSLKTANEVINYGMELDMSGNGGLLAEMQSAGLNDDVIKRIFIDLILAAGDTTAFTTQWALYALSKDAWVQHEVRQAIIDSSNSGATQNETTIPLVKGCVREAMRMFPVATFVGRILGTDALLGDFKIDQHTLVLISMYSAGRDPISFPQPHQFMPSRWTRHPITGQLGCVHRPQSSVPYALGARNCIGQKIANIQMHSGLSKILKHFELKLLNETIKPIMRLVIVPSVPLKLGIKKL